MIHSRRGLSDIVTNVLIILLVLVAVGIVWYFVQPFIRGSAGNIEGSQDCLTIDVVPVSCVENAPGDYNVTVNRNSGGGTLQQLKLVFADSTGNTKVVSQDTTMSEFESDVFNNVLTTPGVADAANLKIAAVVQITNDPAGRTCDIRPAVVACNPPAP